MNSAGYWVWGEWRKSDCSELPVFLLQSALGRVCRTVCPLEWSNGKDSVETLLNSLYDPSVQKIVDAQASEDVEKAHIQDPPIVVENLDSAQTWS